VPQPEVGHLLPLAFLAPGVVMAVLAGDDIDQAVLTHTRNVLDPTGEWPRFGTVLGR
jgi:hypothetical protein